MTENTPSEAMELWRDALTAFYMGKFVGHGAAQAAAAVIADALAERDAEIARLREAHDKAGHLLDTFRFESDADVFRLIDDVRAVRGGAKV